MVSKRDYIITCRCCLAVSTRRPVSRQRFSPAVYVYAYMGTRSRLSYASLIHVGFIISTAHHAAVAVAPAAAAAARPLCCRLSRLASIV